MCQGPVGPSQAGPGFSADTLASPGAEGGALSDHLRVLEAGRSQPLRQAGRRQSSRLPSPLPFVPIFETHPFSGLVRNRESFDSRSVSSTILTGEDGFSARFGIPNSHRLGARCGVTGDILAFCHIAKLWTTRALSAPYSAPKRHLRSLFL